MKGKALTLGLICLIVFSTPYCSDFNYYEAETDEQAESFQAESLNDIAFKILDKKASQPILRPDRRQHSYTDYRYVIIGDVRSNKYSDDTDSVNPIFISLLDSIALLIPQPDFIIILGDLVMWGSKIQYQNYYDLVSNWMKTTDIAAFNVPGNHEFYKRNSFEFYEEFIGDLNYCFDWKDSTFVILNNCQQPGDSLDNPQYRIEDFQLEFLSSVLKTSRSLKFVCTHVPYDGGEPLRQGYAEFLDILTEQNVAISWEAHHHYFKRYWHNDVLHIITGGGGAELPSPKPECPPLFFNTKHHFLVVDIRRNRIEIKVYFYQEGFSSGDYNIILDIL